MKVDIALNKEAKISQLIDCCKFGFINKYGSTKCHDCNYEASKNTRFTAEHHEKKLPRVFVWCGLSVFSVTGALFFWKHGTGQHVYTVSVHLVNNNQVEKNDSIKSIFSENCWSHISNQKYLSSIYPK